jgi:hypothetical protein
LENDPVITEDNDFLGLDKVKRWQNRRKRHAMKAKGKKK